jgi:hypothetical protein
VKKRQANAIPPVGRLMSDHQLPPVSRVLKLTKDPSPVDRQLT